MVDRSLKGVRLVFCTRFGKPQPGDLVTFPAPINLKQFLGVDKGSRFTKRLVAVDPYVIYRGDKVYVNGEEYERDVEMWKRKFKFILDDYAGKMKGYFVVGDVINSVDSRYLGTIKEADRCFKIK